MKKRLFSLILMLTILLSFFVVAPIADATVIPANRPVKIMGRDYTKSYGRSIATDVPITYDGALSFNVYQWIEYELDFKESGDYEIVVYSAIGTASTVDLTVSIDGVTKCTSTIAASGSWSQTTTNVFPIINITEGKHTLRFLNESGGNHFYYFTIEKVIPKTGSFAKNEGSYKTTILPTIIEAENYDLGKDGSKSLYDKNHGTGTDWRIEGSIDIFRTEDSGYAIMLQPNEYTYYSFDVENDGIYNMSVSSSTKGKIKISFDGYPLSFEKELNPFVEETFIENIYLKKGSYRMLVEPAEDIVVIDYIRFSKGDGEYLTLEEKVEEKRQQVDEKAKINGVYKNIYVSMDGSDSADGSRENPYRTLSRAKEEIAKINDDMTGDIVVNIMSDYFKLDATEYFTEEHSGKNGYNVIIRGEDRLNPPVVHGGTELKGWEKHNDILWKIKAPQRDEIRNLYINGYPAVRAKSKYTYMAEAFYDNSTTSYAKDGFYTSAINFPETLSNSEDIELIWSLEWGCLITPVESVEKLGERVLFHMENPCFDSTSGVYQTTIDPKDYFFIENAPELLDEPGEFYYNKKDGYIYYYAYKSDDLLNAETYIGDVEFLVNASGKDLHNKITNLVFDNVDFRYSVWNYPGKYGLKVSQADSITDTKGGLGDQKLWMLPAQLQFNYADGIKIVNCRFSCLGSNAVSMVDGVENSLVSGNVFKDVSGGGVVIGSWEHENEIEGLKMCKNIEVSNNVFRRMCGEFRSCTAISIYYESHIDVLNNDIEDQPYTAITAGWGWGTTNPATPWGNIHISNNRIEDVMSSMRDGSHIYTLGSLRNSTIDNNYLLDSKYILSGVYNDSGSAYVNIFDNVIEGKLGDYWWYQGHYLTHDMHAYNNYVTSNVMRESAASNITENTIHVPDKNWPDEAKKIISSAGVEKSYSNLLSLGNRPEGKKSRLEAIPVSSFIPSEKFEVKEGTVQAEDFLAGGEGVGYHKIVPLPANNEYRPATDEVSLYKGATMASYVIDRNFPGEWVQYEIDIKENGTYYLDATTGHAWTPNDDQPASNWYVDGKLVFTNVKIPKSEDWNTLIDFNIGQLELTEGKHTIRMEFLGNGFYFDAFRIHRDEPKDIVDLKELTDPNYDECVIVYEK